MERGMMGNYHVLCGTEEKLEIISNAYLLQTLAEEGTIQARIPNLLKLTADPTHPKQVLVHYKDEWYHYIGRSMCGIN